MRLKMRFSHSLRFLHIQLPRISRDGLISARGNRSRQAAQASVRSLTLPS